MRLRKIPHQPERCNKTNVFLYSQARRKWGAGRALAPLVFGQTVNPISIRGADYAHHSNPRPPPGFSDLATALTMLSKRLQGVLH